MYNWWLAAIMKMPEEKKVAFSDMILNPGTQFSQKKSWHTTQRGKKIEQIITAYCNAFAAPTATWRRAFHESGLLESST
jgi:hypothetical protein